MTNEMEKQARMHKRVLRAMHALEIEVCRVVPGIAHVYSYLAPDGEQWSAHFVFTTFTNRNEIKEQHRIEISSWYHGKDAIRIWKEFEAKFKEKYINNSNNAQQ